MSNDSQNQDQISLEKEFDLASDFTPPTYQEWKAAAEQYLKGVPFEKALVTRTYEGIDLQPIYSKEDIKDLPHLEEKPGSGNYVRGTTAGGYLAQPWEICQAIHSNTPGVFNANLKDSLAKGQTAVLLTPDKATQLGRDDDEAITGDVGAEGISISNLDDFSVALKDIDLEKFPLHINTGFSGLEMLMALNAYLKQKGKKLAGITGSIDTDPLAFMALYGKLPASLEQVFDNMKKTVTWTAKNAPRFKTIGVSGAPYNSAGASAVQELAFALATAVEYIDRMLEGDLTIDEIAGNVRFTFAIGPFYFMEVAKLRAARIMWANIVAAYGGNKESQKMTIHGVTSFHNQTIYDPYVNMLRTSTEAFSGVVGGVDSLQTNPFDEIFGQPDEFSRRVTRNMQIILKEEAHLDQLIDPAGGSYFVEKLTHDVAEKSWVLFKDIQNRGGMLKAMEAGFPQAEIEAVNAKRKKDLCKRKAVMVGTNSYANVKEEKLEIKTPDYDKLHRERAQRLKAYKGARPTDKKTRITEMMASLHTSEDVVKTGTDALLAGATLGEIAAAKKPVESSTVKPLRIHRMSEIFEELRDAASVAKPKLFLATMGPLGQYKGRADFSKGFFEVGGFDVLYPNGFDVPEKAVEAALESGAPVVVICSSDPTYPELVPVIVKGLKDKNPDIVVVLAGYPKDQAEAHKKSGVDEFIYLGADVHRIISTIYKKIGVLS
ncbi:MAG: methylmalonyl-CoA mutase [bacterium]|nr:methylmalonyl-CoA mutase [bacterium]